MNKILSLLAIGGLFFASCEEVPVKIDTTERGKDTTYIASVESKQQKMFLAEELSGVKCVNCPAGAAKIHEMATSGAYAGKIIIATIHAGTLTSKITTAGHESTQDFRTEDGENILNNIFGGDPGKPVAGFDRLPLATNGSSPILDYTTRWLTMMNEATISNSNNPVNVYVTSEPAAEPNTYFIEVKVAYTEALTGRQAISLYLTEDNIIDIQEFPTEYKSYTFNHTFRKSIAPFNGLEILNSLATKEAGRVLIQNFTLTINPSDEKEKFWVPANMHLIAFVHKLDDDKRVLQAAETKLIP